ncbi:AtpZ/AtpI family protein [Caulobacter sp. S45]|jgi:ATP synthase protein I|uniref:AtpZ/AtpI family protein n=1 Tax=Caulobacter sp. S45 TaxID=1641861 RepID=UPI00131DE228|nr:AtpZ/AtpI family protein [Caulobacter sp. S45]
MPEPQKPRDEAFKRFDARYDALDATTRRKPSGHAMESGAGAGYRLIGELVGGVLTGLGLGWLVDHVAGTQPIGLIGGMLIGTGAAIFLVVRSAGRMSGASVARPEVPPVAAPTQDENDDAG